MIQRFSKLALFALLFVGAPGSALADGDPPEGGSRVKERIEVIHREKQNPDDDVRRDKERMPQPEAPRERERRERP